MLPRTGRPIRERFRGEEVGELCEEKDPTDDESKDEGSAEDGKSSLRRLEESSKCTGEDGGESWEAGDVSRLKAEGS